MTVAGDRDQPARRAQVTIDAPVIDVRGLRMRYGTVDVLDGIADLEVRRASLEDTYMTMVHRHETGHAEDAVTEFERVDR